MQDMNPNAAIKEISLPLFNAKFWMKLWGVVLIIGGVGMIISTLGIGILIAWLPIWLGVLLFQSANAIEHAYQSGDSDSAVRALDKLKLFFIINGIVRLITIILSILLFLFFGSMIGGMMAQYQGAAGMGGML